VEETLRNAYGNVVRHYKFRGREFKESKHYEFIRGFDNGLEAFFLHAILDIFEECKRPRARRIQSIITETYKYYYYIYFHDIDNIFTSTIDRVKAFVRNIEVHMEIERDLDSYIVERYARYPRGIIYVIG